MNRALFVSLDGPKGTGKTTLLEAVTQALRGDGKKVIRLSERNNDPGRAETMRLVNALARAPDPALELAVCRRLAESRAWITQHVLPRQPADSILLIDRWYPSDAAFRRQVPFADILRINLEHDVRVPDLQVAVLAAADISWARAAARSRGLSSTVLLRFEEHSAATQAFERATAEQGWLACRNEGTLAAATAQIVAAIHRALLAPLNGAG